jgi:hypothetical protein
MLRPGRAVLRLGRPARRLGRPMLRLGRPVRLGRLTGQARLSQPVPPARPRRPG